MHDYFTMLLFKLLVKSNHLMWQVWLDNGKELHFTGYHVTTNNIVKKKNC